MSIDYIRTTYRVPARVGGRVRYRGGTHVQEGTIKDASGGHLLILLDDGKHALPFHPTWKLDFL